jgi:1-acyl-sn-glycerol-3-phosphate acyltransferase
MGCVAMAEDLAKMKEQVYRDARPAEHFARFHARSRRRAPDWVYEAVRVVLTTYAVIVFRARSIGSERVPSSGPIIFAPNHSSFMDHFFVAAFTRRKVSFMAKSQLFTRPLQFIFDHGGVFPVRRGERDEDAFLTADAILARGGTIGMYCEGGRSRTGKLADRAKPGIGRLALESGAMIVPVAIQGSAQVRNWRRLQFPKVTVLFGEPFRYEVVAEPSRDQQRIVADAILDEIRALHGQLETLGRAGVRRRLRAAAGEPAPA